MVTNRHKLVYNVLWQLPCVSVDFSGDAMWKELGQLPQSGKLTPELSRLYFVPTRPMFELFDLETDPAELTNLSGRSEVAEVERGLKEALHEWMILQRDFVPLLISPLPKKPKK